MAVVFPTGIEVFGNCSSCVAAAGSGGTNGTSNPAAGTTETWTVSTGSTSFPAAQTSTVPNNYFYVRDPADTTNEIVLVTDNTTPTTWHVQRGMNGATVAHSSGATWVQVISPYTAQNFKQAVSAAVSPVTITTSTTETVLASYLPAPSEITAGSSYEIIAYGPITAHGGTVRGTVGFNIYWGGSGAPGSAFTSTGSTRVASLVTNANTPPLAATTVIAGASFDVNGTLTIQAVSGSSASSVHCNLNTWLAAGAALNSVPLVGSCVNTTASGGASGSGPVSVTTGTGPIILTAVWTANYTVYGLTAVAPLIYRAA